MANSDSDNQHQNQLLDMFSAGRTFAACANLGSISEPCSSRDAMLPSVPCTAEPLPDRPEVVEATDARYRPDLEGITDVDSTSTSQEDDSYSWFETESQAEGSWGFSLPLLRAQEKDAFVRNPWHQNYRSFSGEKPFTANYGGGRYSHRPGQHMKRSRYFGVKRVLHDGRLGVNIKRCKAHMNSPSEISKRLGHTLDFTRGIKHNIEHKPKPAHLHNKFSLNNHYVNRPISVIPRETHRCVAYSQTTDLPLDLSMKRMPNKSPGKEISRSANCPSSTKSSAVQEPFTEDSGYLSPRPDDDKHSVHQAIQIDDQAISTTRRQSDEGIGVLESSTQKNGLDTHCLFSEAHTDDNCLQNSAVITSDEKTFNAPNSSEEAMCPKFGENDDCSQTGRPTSVTDLDVQEETLTMPAEDRGESRDNNRMVNLAQKETNSTKRVTDWSVGIFRRWMAEAPSRAAVPSLLKMTVPQINTFLCKFLVEARKSNGSRYPSKSLQALGQGLLRYVRNNRVYSIRECGSADRLFKPVNQVLSMELRRTLFYENLHGRMPKVRQKKGCVKKKGACDLNETAKQQQNHNTQSVYCQSRESSQEAPLVFPDLSADDKADTNSLDVTLDTQKKSEEDSNDQSAILPQRVKATEKFTADSSPVAVPTPLSSAVVANQEQTTKVRRKSTLRNTRWAVHHFNRWRFSQETSDNKPIPDVVDMSVTDVNIYLGDYISSVMKADGTSYIPSCLYSLACGLLRHARSQGRHDLNFMNSKDDRFADFQAALSARLKSLGQVDPKDKPKLPPLKLLTPEQEEKLWQFHVFGTQTAKSLQYSVFYYNFKIFGIRSYLGHRSLRRLQFAINKEEVEGVESVCFDSWCGQRVEGSAVSHTYREKVDSAPRSIVELYEVYLTAIGPTGPFYKRLLGLQGPTTRFSDQSVGIRTLQAIWMDICEAASLEG